jgi:hypothetical protein
MNRIFLVPLLASPLFGESNIEITARGVTIPIFDAATGKLTKRLDAESASGPFDEPRLGNAVVLIYPAKGPDAEPMARIFFDDATYHRAIKLVTGSGMVHLQTTKGKAEGLGYQYGLDTNRLLIKSRCHLETDDYLVDADDANLLLAKGPTSDELVIRELDARGNVTVIPKTSAKATFERAVTDHAWYKAADQILHLAPPVHTRMHGEESEMSANVIEMRFRAP